MDATSSETFSNIAKDYLNIKSLESLTNSTEWQNTTDEIPLQYVVFYNIADGIYFYGLSVVIPFGLIGNFFSDCVFLLSSILRRTTTAQFLIVLAIADTTVLVGDIMRWLSHYHYVSGHYYLSPSLGLNFYNTSNVACRITLFLRYGGGLCSVWLTVAIAVERLLAVAFPLKIGRISTTRRSRIVILVITFISFSLALFAFWHVEIDAMPQCKLNEHRKDEYYIWNAVILKFGTLIIPGVCIAILTAIIIVLLYRARKKRNAQLASCTKNFRNQFAKCGLSTETQLTIMLVAVCVSTTALRAPYMIAYYLRDQCVNDSDCNSRRKMETFVASRVTEVFNIVHFAINFMLYCFCGSSFRRQLRMTLIHEASLGNCLRNRPVTQQLQQLG